MEINFSGGCKIFIYIYIYIYTYIYIYICRGFYLSGTLRVSSLSLSLCLSFPFSLSFFFLFSFFFSPFRRKMHVSIECSSSRGSSSIRHFSPSANLQICISKVGGEPKSRANRYVRTCDKGPLPRAGTYTHTHTPRARSRHAGRQAGRLAGRQAGRQASVHMRMLLHVEALPSTASFA